MASKDISKSKGLGKDPSLCRLGQRMIHTMLREERVAERDLQVKLKAISAKERKSLVKLGCDSLEVRHDLSRQRSGYTVVTVPEDVLDAPNHKGMESHVDLDNNLVRPGLQGRRAISMINYSSKQEQVSLVDETRRVDNGNTTRSHLKSFSHLKPTIMVENHAETCQEISNDKHSLNMECIKSLSLEKLNVNTEHKHTNTGSKLIAPSDEKSLSSTVTSPRLLKRRPVSDITSSSFSQTSCLSEVNEVFVDQIPLEKGLSTSKVSDLQRVPQRPSTPPPARRSQTTLSADVRKQRPSSARLARPKSPALSSGSTEETVRGRDRIRLDLPQDSTPTRIRSPSPTPSPSRLSPDPLRGNLGRRGSGPPRINVNTLPASSPLRKGLGASDVTQRLCLGSPDALRRRRSANEEELQDRVQGFLKALGKK